MPSKTRQSMLSSPGSERREKTAPSSMAQDCASENSAPESVDGSNPNSAVMFLSSNAKQRSAHEVADSDQSSDDGNGGDSADAQGRMKRTMENAELNTRSDDEDEDEGDDSDDQPKSSSPRPNAGGSSKIPSLPIPPSTSTTFPHRRGRLELPDSVFVEAATERAASKAQRERNELLERERAAAATPKKKKRKVTNKSEDLVSGSRIVRTLPNSSRAEPAPATGSIDNLLKAATRKAGFKRKSANLVVTKQSRGFAPAIGFSSFRR